MELEVRKQEKGKRRALIATSFVIVVGSLMVLASCGQKTSEREPSPTLKEAVAALREHDQTITKALEARNPSAADNEMHQAMYLADHLHEFSAGEDVDQLAVKASAKRLFELLMQAHNGAHSGGTEGWDPNAVSDEMTGLVEKLEGLAK